MCAVPEVPRHLPFRAVAGRAGLIVENVRGGDDDDDDDAADDAATGHDNDVLIRNARLNTGAWRSGSCAEHLGHLFCLDCRARAWMPRAAGVGGGGGGGDDDESGGDGGDGWTTVRRSKQDKQPRGGGFG